MHRRVGVAGDENFLTRGGITLGGCANDMTSFGNPNCTGQMALPHLDPVPAPIEGPGWDLLEPGAPTEMLDQVRQPALIEEVSAPQG